MRNYVAKPLQLRVLVIRCRRRWCGFWFRVVPPRPARPNLTKLKSYFITVRSISNDSFLSCVMHWLGFAPYAMPQPESELLGQRYTQLDFHYGFFE